MANSYASRLAVAIQTHGGTSVFTRKLPLKSVFDISILIAIAAYALLNFLAVSLSESPQLNPGSARGAGGLPLAWGAAPHLAIPWINSVHKCIDSDQRKS
jgi:hypothetical protein